MSVEVPVLEVCDLADRLASAAGRGEQAAGRLRGVADAGALTAELERFTEAFALTSGALAVETEQLGRALEAVARSWLALDAELAARCGLVLAR